jgi:CBS domain-containing protein
MDRAPRASAAAPGRGGARRDRPRRRARTRRILAAQGVFDAIIPLVGLLGRPVRNQSQQEIGRLVDVVARWSGSETYPPVAGLVVRIGRRLAYVNARDIDRFGHAEIVLRSARLDLRDFIRRPDEVMLGHDVLDHQLVDVDGVQVIRAADLYLADVLGRIRLVGVDVSPATLLRRLGPRRWRTAPTPDRVIDWAAIQPFGEPGEEASGLRLRQSNAGLRRLRPGELADLLEDLRRDERQALLSALPEKEAADALEEMQADDLAQLLRDLHPGQAARLLAEMEPDEAAEALRDLPPERRRELLGRMPTEAARPLTALLGYPEDEAGGFMTTNIVVVAAHDAVSQVADLLARGGGHDSDIESVAVVDPEGRLAGDLPLLDLLIALHRRPDERVGALLDDEEPVTVSLDTGVQEVAERLVEARRLSLVVVEDDRPVGRILADDVLDVLVPGKGRFHFPQLLTQT